MLAVYCLTFFTFCQDIFLTVITCYYIVWLLLRAGSIHIGSIYIGSIYIGSIHNGSLLLDYYYILEV